MLRAVVRRVTGKFAERMVRAAQSTGEPPRPSGPPRVHAMGPDPDRILIIGANAVRGIGVASHELGIGGHVARRLSALTGRGADVELIGVPGITAEAAGRLLAEADLGRFDALVVMLGGREAVGLRPAETWARDIRALLQQLAEEAPELSVFVVGVARLSTAVPFHRLLGPVVGRQAARLNAATREAAAATGASFIPFDLPAGRGLGDTGGTAAYAAWAEPIVRHLHKALRSVPPVSRGGDADEEARQASLDEMGIVDTPPTSQLEALARTAKDLFGVWGAAVNLIDRDRQHMKAAAGIEKADWPRSESFCSTTVALGTALVVEDTRDDPRFEAFAAVADGLRFYAGYPVEAPNGQPIGTLCLLDTAPRTFSTADRSLLRELALRVQAELWSESRG